MRILHVLYFHETEWPIRGAAPEPVLAMRTDKYAAPFIERLKSADGVGNPNLRQIQQGSYVYWAVPERFKDHVMKLAREHFVEVAKEPYPLALRDHGDAHRAVRLTGEASPYNWIARVIEVGDNDGKPFVSMVGPVERPITMGIDRDQARWFAQNLYQLVMITIRPADEEDLKDAQDA